MKLTFTEDAALWQSRFAALKALAESRVDVGLTSSASGRSLFLMAIYEHGAPVMRIPPRPVIDPALAKDSAREQMTAAIISALDAAMASDPDGNTAGLESCGEAGMDAIHAYIDAGVPPPNSPVTVTGGWIYNRVAKTGVPVKGKDFNKPLYANVTNNYGCARWIDMNGDIVSEYGIKAQTD